MKSDPDIPASRSWGMSVEPLNLQGEWINRRDADRKVCPCREVGIEAKTEAEVK